MKHPGFQTDDEFGASVALNGNDLIVGAPGRNGDKGSAYIFHRDGLAGRWTLENELVGNVTGERMGASVDIGEEYAAAGAPGASNSSTADSVYLYRKLAGSWSFYTKLPTIPQAGNEFGTSVHLDPTTLFVGAPGSSATPGSVFVYGLAPNPGDIPPTVMPTGPTTLTANGGMNGDRFGASIDGSGNYVVIGAPGVVPTPTVPSPVFTTTGAAYVFERPTATMPSWNADASGLLCGSKSSEINLVLPWPSTARKSSSERPAALRRHGDVYSGRSL